MIEPRDDATDRPERILTSRSFAGRPSHHELSLVIDAHFLDFDRQGGVRKIRSRFLLLGRHAHLLWAYLDHRVEVLGTRFAVLPLSVQQ